jgi:septum formation protein
MMLYLASQSPRRRELLEQIGVRFETLQLDLPEARAPGESPEDYVCRVSREKAEAGLSMLSGMSGIDLNRAIVLGGDTEVVLGDEVFGKPGDAEHAEAMLRKLSGRTHEVISVVWLVAAGRAQHVISRTRVTFAALDEAALAAYVASGEPMGRAGAYAIQGRAAAFVSRIEGSYSGVMGLPLFETSALLHAFGIARA